MGLKNVNVMQHLALSFRAVIEFLGILGIRYKYFSLKLFSIDLMAATPTQIYGINTIFDCRFPLPETFKYTEDILEDFSVKEILRVICKQVRCFCERKLLRFKKNLKINRYHPQISSIKCTGAKTKNPKNQLLWRGA